MASSSPWEEMEENYFVCPICLDNLKDPRLLPCLHRYCRPCLAPIVGRHHGEFDCPMCKTACVIPENGVDGFKTDFHVQNMLEFIALQKSVKSEESQTCKGCKKKETVIAYCFKCKGFLCDQWYQFHLDNDIFQDHKDHVLLLADIIDKKLSLQKLASLKIAPRCHVHTEKPAEVCCETCNNLPICMVCSNHGKHKGHRISDVKETAMKERAKIRKVVGRVEQYQAKVYNLPRRLEEARERLGRSLSEEKDKLQSQYQEKLEQINKMMKETDDLLAERKAKIQKKEIEELTELHKERSLELGAAAKKINERFDELENEVKRRCKSYREEQEQIFGEKIANLEDKLVLLDQAATVYRELIDTQGERAAKKLAVASSESEGRIRRLDNFTSTVSSILVAEDDWTDSQCLPDVSSASGPLEEEVKKELMGRDTISAIDTRELPPEDKLVLLDQAATVYRELIDTQGERAAKELADASSESEVRIRRIDNFTSTVSSILAAEDDWTDSQCLPDVSSASGPLEEELKRELLVRDTISAIDTRELPPVVDNVSITENPESVVEIDEIKHKDGFVMTAAADSRGVIVISGKASSTHAFVTAVDANGKLLWQKSFESTDKNLSHPKCYSAILSKKLSVNACTFNKVSIFHIHDGSVASTYDFRDEATHSTHGSDITNNWKETKRISCVTCDPANKDVYIGSINPRCKISREILVLNDKLKYKHTIVLPDDICWARDITFHRGHLLVCDCDEKAGYIVSVDKLNTEIVHRFTKPTLWDGDWYPAGVCTDSKEFIYIMWEAKVDNKWKHIVTQYSPDNHKLMLTKPVDDDAAALITTFIDGKEKLLVITRRTGKMYIYELVTG